MPDWLIPVLSFLGGALGAYVTFRIRFERFEAMDTRREQDWSNWRKDITKDVENLQSPTTMTQLALLTQVLETLVKRVEELWKYATDIKHLQVDPYVRATDVLKQRVDNLEKK